jgi:hypothetical protein
MHLADERAPRPPDYFIMFMSVPSNPAYGAYPGVFSYRFQTFPDVKNLHYWALLILDRILLTVTFHDFGCACAGCTKRRGDWQATLRQDS